MDHKCTGILAGLPQTERGKAFFISADPKGKKFLYWSANSVYIRDIENPGEVDIYTQHAKYVTVAKFAPSGFYIASGDVSGKVRIWDTINAEHILKAEYPVLGGHIKDLCWSPDSKRLAVVGEGREKFGAVIMMDTGTSVGEISGHSKIINSVDYKTTRPYRVITGSDDMSVRFFEGPPFKLTNTSQDFVKYVNCVRFSPDGTKFIAGTAGGQIAVYDGKTGAAQGSFEAHSMGIYALAFKGDSTQFMSVSADKTAKVWDLETKKLVTDFKMGTALEDMQLSCLWQEDHMLTVSLSGEINYLDESNPTKPLRVLRGHQGNVTSVVISEDKSTIFSADHKGKVCYWNVATLEGNNVKGHHENQVTDMHLLGNRVVSIGIDDQMKFMNTETKEFENQSASLEAQPRSVCQGANGLIAVTTVQHIFLYKNNNVVFSQKEAFECFGVSIHPGQTQLAVGGDDAKVHIYSIENDTLKEVKTLAIRGVANCVEYSPDGAFLSCGGAEKAMSCWDVANDYTPIIDTLVMHRARINAIAWAPDSRHFASCGLSGTIIIWNTETPKKQSSIRSAHQIYNVSCLVWLDNNTIISGGFDHCLRRWAIKV